MPWWMVPIKSPRICEVDVVRNVHLRGTSTKCSGPLILRADGHHQLELALLLATLLALLLLLFLALKGTHQVVLVDPLLGGDEVVVLYFAIS